MRQGTRRWFGLLFVCATIPACLLNSVHSITKARWTKPDSTHAIVVIGVGLDVPWQYTAFQLTFAEYSRDRASRGIAFITIESKSHARPLPPRSSILPLKSQQTLMYF